MSALKFPEGITYTNHKPNVEGNTSPITNKQKRRLIPLWKKADWEGLGRTHVQACRLFRPFN